jgi:hypothetical protein
MNLNQLHNKNHLRKWILKENLQYREESYSVSYIYCFPIDF